MGLDPLRHGTKPLPHRILQIGQLYVKRIQTVEIRPLGVRHCAFRVEQHQEVVGSQAIASTSQLELLPSHDTVPLLHLHHIVGRPQRVQSRRYCGPETKLFTAPEVDSILVGVGGLRRRPLTAETVEEGNADVQAC